MASLLRRVAAVAMVVTAIGAALPAAVAAECNGPACRPPDQGVEGLGAILLLVILASFVTILAAAEARRR